MIKSGLAIAFLCMTSVAWAGDLAQAQDTKQEITAEQKAKLETALKILNEKKAEIEALQEKNKIASEKWLQDLESGIVGRFQIVAMGPSSAIVLDTKEGRLWVVGGTPETGPKIFYMGQVNLYSIPGK